MNNPTINEALAAWQVVKHNLAGAGTDNWGNIVESYLKIRAKAEKPKPLRKKAKEGWSVYDCLSCGVTFYHVGKTGKDCPDCNTPMEIRPMGGDKPDWLKMSENGQE